MRKHRQAATGVARPLFLRPVPIKLHPVVVRVAQIKRLAHAVIRRAVQFNARRQHAPQQDQRNQVGYTTKQRIVTHSSDPLVGIVGSGKVAIRNGQMPSLQLTSNLRTLAKLASVGPTNGDPSSFSSLSTEFRIADARLTNNKISLAGNGVDVDGSGSMTMAGEGSLDYQGDGSLAANGNNPLATVLGGLAGAKFADGKMIFPFTVGGTFAKPKFSVKGAAEQGGVPGVAAQEPIKAVRGLAGLLKKQKQQ